MIIPNLQQRFSLGNRATGVGTFRKFMVSGGISIRRSRDIPEIYGLRRYSRVSRVVLFFLQHSVINFSRSMRANDIEANVIQTLGVALFRSMSQIWR